MTPIWLTVVVSVLSVGGALGAQWIAGLRASRLAAVEHDFQRADRRYRNREDAYLRFLVAARPIPAASTVSAGVEPAMAALRDAAAYVELHAPGIADGPLGPVLDAAERLVAVTAGNSSSAPVVTEARREYDDALAALRDRMRADLKSMPSSDTGGYERPDSRE